MASWRGLSPWTVRRQVWSDSLAANHSGVSTDVLLFSDINLFFSLTHHYRVHKYGLPRIAFRKNYLTRLRVSVSQAAGQSRHDTTYPAASSPVSTRHARSAERESETSRLTRRGRRRLRPVRILEESVSELPTLTSRIPRTCRVPSSMTVGLRCCLFLCDSTILGRCICV